MAKEIVMKRKGKRYRVLLNKDGTFKRFTAFAEPTGKVGITLKSKVKSKVKAKVKTRRKAA